MPTTSNFGWTTPADTDLVKDGAAAIRTLGNGIDTSLVDLKGGTTGQVLSKNSNTDLDYTWVTPNVGDITEVQAGTGISVASGTGPIPVVTNTVATAYDAKGDLIVGTGADTFAKLTVGTNGHTLVADSSTSTGLKWAAPAAGGAYTLLASGSLSGTEVSLTSISQDYKDLVLFCWDFQPANAAPLQIRVNGDTNNRYITSPTTLQTGTTFNTSRWDVSTDQSTAVDNSFCMLVIPQYATGLSRRFAYSFCQTANPASQAQALGGLFNLFYNQTTAISSLQIRMDGNTINSGTYELYGVK